MSGNLRLNGAVSGYSQISAPDNAGDQLYILPDNGGGTLVSTAGAAFTSYVSISRPQAGNYALETFVGDASGTIIKAGGDIETQGNITAGDYTTPVSYISGAKMYANINPKSATTNNSAVACVADGGNNGTVFVRNTAGDAQILLAGPTGNITAAGQITAGSLSYDGTCFSGLSDGSQIMYFGQASPANAIIYACTQAGSGNASTFSVTASGTVTSKGSVLTLASGDLDVGDKLKKADDALTAIKAAVSDTSTDLAGLKVAILAALSNH